MSRTRLLCHVLLISAVLTFSGVLDISAQDAGTPEAMSAVSAAVGRPMFRGNTPEQRFMGRWSDGVPVAELVITDNPMAAAAPAAPPAP